MGGDHLTAKQQRFVDEYLVDLNATQAAIRSGYSEKTARSQGQRLLTHVDIVEAIESAQQARSERIQVDADWVLQQAVKLHERCMADGEAFNANAAARSLELVGKHINIQAFRDNVGLNGNLKISHEDALGALR